MNGPSRKINKNLSTLKYAYENGYRGVVLEGSSRSGKTWAGIDFIVYLCFVIHERDNVIINIVRDTYNSFKTTLYDDFNKRLPMYGIDSPLEGVQEKATFFLNGNKIQLIGADKPSKIMGAGSDYAFFNEAIHIKKSVIDQIEMRCRKFWWMDYNPEFTSHWIYDNVIPRDDVYFMKTTFPDNPFLSNAERSKIKSYEPTEENKRQGTVDDYMWKVYGLGQRAAREGAVYNHWTLGEYPKNPETEIIGIDFGYNNPTAVILLGYYDQVMYTKQIVYSSGLVNSDIINLLEPYKRIPMYLDTAEPDRIEEFKRAGFKAFKSNKDVMLGINKVKSTKWVIDRTSRDIIREAEQYVWKTDRGGDTFDIVIKENDHAMDAIRYANFTHWNRPKNPKFQIIKR